MAPHKQRGGLPRTRQQLAASRSQFYLLVVYAQIIAFATASF